MPLRHPLSHGREGVLDEAAAAWDNGTDNVFLPQLPDQGRRVGSPDSAPLTGAPISAISLTRSACRAVPVFM
jgi:hypothetical protein